MFVESCNKTEYFWYKDYWTENVWSFTSKDEMTI